MDHHIRSFAHTLLIRLKEYWESRAVFEDGRRIYRYADPLPEREFSARLLSDLLIGHAALGDLAIVPEFLRQIADRQQPDGAFLWNLPDRLAPHQSGIRDQVDLAQILDALHRLERHCPLSRESSILIGQITRRAVAYLETAGLPGHPGVVRKRDYGPDFPYETDILNGDLLTARAFFCAADLLDDPNLLVSARPYLEHIAERFGQHYPGWWPYSEALSDRRVVPSDRPGHSLFFQAFMLIPLREMAAHPNIPFLRNVYIQAQSSLVEVFDSTGRPDWNRESRREFVGLPHAIFVHALLDAGENGKARGRLEFINHMMVDRSGDVCNEVGRPVIDLWKIWLFSDLGRLLLS